MRRIGGAFAIGAACALFIAGCASQPKGPMVSTPPTVSVSSFQSTSFSPTLVKYEAKVLIHNNAEVDLEFQRVNYAVDLFDTELFTDSFRDVRKMRANGDQTVTFPFQIAVKDISDQGIDVLSEQSIRVTFRGEVLTAARYGMDPVPFIATVTVPLPAVPDVTYLGSEGDPLSEAWRLHFSVTNKNSFPVTLTSVQTFVVLNDKKYSLVHSRGPTDLQPGVVTPVDLQMENSPGKALSMALNLAVNRDIRFNITGQITCKTQYGWIYIPLDLEEALTGG
jgi:LEA14-like dessication related protein